MMGADAGNASEQVLVLLPDWALTDGLIEIFVGTPELGLKPADVSLDRRTALEAPLRRWVSATIISVICRLRAIRARIPR
jgi:hypothetical protein